MRTKTFVTTLLVAGLLTTGAFAGTNVAEKHCVRKAVTRTQAGTFEVISTTRTRGYHGTCTLTLTKEGKTVNRVTMPRTNDAIYERSFTCSVQCGYGNCGFQSLTLAGTGETDIYVVSGIGALYVNTGGTENYDYENVSFKLTDDGDDLLQQRPSEVVATINEKIEPIGYRAYVAERTYRNPKTGETRTKKIIKIEKIESEDSESAT